MNVLTRAYDFCEAPARAQPNYYNITQAEIVLQGRLDLATKSVSSYPPLVVQGGRFQTDKIQIISLLEVG